MPTLARITRELLASYGRRPRKRLGQHFLIDPQVLQRILDAGELAKDDAVLEIGTGLGILTKELADRVQKVVTIEIDKELLKIAKEVLKDYSNVEFVHGDILKFPVERWTKIVGNLPYYITAPIVEKILEARPERAVLTVQKEVAERMAASSGSKKYGSFSIFVQYHAEVKLDSFVSKSSFYPWPQVSSAIVVMKPCRQPRYAVRDEKLFFDLVHAAFQQRRKKLKNSLAEFKLDGSGADLNRRPETLGLEEFAALANYCYNLRSHA